jgi:RNA-directed DNA polymerase
MTRTPSRDSMSTNQQRIAELARQAPQLGFTTLAHHMDQTWLLQAYQATRKGGATGIDGQNGADYEVNLEQNLQALENQAKSGKYRAPPVRRAWIPKGTGSETRPLGIPTFEDKVLQRAVVMLLEPIYEQDFLDCSYGYRPGRSAHQALETVRQQTMAVGGGWILEVDIRKFFETLDHAQLREMLHQRVRDGVVLRLIDKWLNAGVLEAGDLTTPDAGTPQGGVISPLLANIYLHTVLDVWFERDVKPHLQGKAFLVRYADDVVLIFQHESDAKRVQEVLPKRLAKYGLNLNEAKSGLAPFTRPTHSTVPEPGKPRPQTGTFDLLGFTHYWGKSRRGYWVVKRKTARDRFARALGKIAAWCRKHYHKPVAEQCRTLGQKMLGHFSYYGVTGNYYALQGFRDGVRRLWFKWLSRRQRHGYFSWSAYQALLQRHPLPRARVVHSVYRTAANP